MTITLPIAQARSKLTQLPKELHGQDTVEITSKGKPVLAVIPWELYESIIETLEILGDEELSNAVRRGIKDYKLKKTVPWEDAKRKLGL